MARRQRCPQCGAPHRLLAAQSRFRCDYCSALVELREEAKFEIWQIGSMRSARDAERCAHRWLRERDLPGARVLVDGPLWAVAWQVNSRDGEEFHRDCSPRPHPLLQQLPLPAGARVDPDVELTPPTADRAEIEAAAQASFRDPKAAIESTRLLYQPLQRLRLRLADGREVPALYLCAGDQLLVAPIPAAARLRRPDAALLARYGIFATFCLATGAIVDPWPARAFAMAFAFTAGSLLWRAFVGAKRIA